MTRATVNLTDDHVAKILGDRELLVAIPELNDVRRALAAIGDCETCAAKKRERKQLMASAKKLIAGLAKPRREIVKTALNVRRLLVALDRVNVEF